MAFFAGVNWEFLLNRGLGGGQEGGEEAARARDVDVDCPHSVLGLKLRSSFTHGQLQRAFRKELLLHHPDHRPEAEKAKAVSRLVKQSVSVSASQLSVVTLQPCGSSGRWFTALRLAGRLQYADTI